MPAAQNTVSKWFKKHGNFAKQLGVGFAVDMGFELATGRGMGAAVKQAALEAMVFEMFPSIGLPLMFGAPLAAVGTQLAKSHYESDKRQFEDMFRPNLGGNYQDTQAAYTMRQRGVQAIQNSRLNARSALGNTARMMHRR